MDRLEKLFVLQDQLQQKMKVKMNIDYLRWNVLALHTELSEALQQTKWKPWKKHGATNYDNFKKEIADCLHFFINICLWAGIDAAELYVEFTEKNKVNIERLEDGY
jgi:dimeric dUTPase (all-alpha-NTP-PPase superfamily)